jgi:hypothetical protein
MAKRSTVTPLRQTRAAALSAILFVAVFAGYARAAECFCLLHTATGAILRGCEAFKAEKDLYPTAYCTDPQTGRESEQTINSDWQRIEAGADRCDPCWPVPRGTRPEFPEELPRGGGIALSSAAQGAKPPSLGNLGASAVFVVGLVSTWMYATGWAYAYHYLDRFGVPLLMVDIPKEHYFVYGWVVLRYFAVSALLIAGVGVLLFATWHWTGVRLGRWALLLGVLAVLVLFWLGHVAGVTAAHEQYRVQRENDYSAYPRVQVWLREDAESLARFSPVLDALASSCYRLLLHNAQPGAIVFDASVQGSGGGGPTSADPAMGSDRAGSCAARIHQLQIGGESAQMHGGATGG